MRTFKKNRNVTSLHITGVPKEAFLKLNNKGKQIMKTLTFLLIFNLINLINLQSGEAQVTQEWVRYWYLNNWGSKAECAATDNSGNTVVTGTAISSGTDIATLKYDSQGNLLWSRIYTNANLYNSDDGVSDLVVDDQNNIYITGFTANSVSANRNIVTIKYSPSGDTLWVRHYAGSGNGNDEGKAIALDDSGNVYVTGYSTTTGTYKDYLTIKYDNNGNEIWVRSSNYLTSVGNIADDIAVDDQGNVYVTGNQNFYLTLKYSSAGDLMWSKTFTDNGGGTSYIEKMLDADRSGNVYVTGTCRGLTTGDDFVTIKYDPSGNQVWLKRYNGPANNIDYAGALKLVYETGNEMHPDLVVAGTSQSNFLTIKYDGDDGNVLWEKRHDGQSVLRSMDIDESGNVIVTGNKYNPSTGDDYLTLKYNGITGDERWSKMYNLGGTSNENAANVSIGPDGAVYVSGTSSAWTNHYLIVKYKEPAELKLTALIEGFYDESTDKMIRDTVTVLLRKTASPFDVVDSVKTVLDSNGKSTLFFNRITNSTPCYIIIKHRNSIETWSSSGVTFTGNPLAYDFTTDETKAFGDNLVLRGIKFCIRSGDVDQSGAIDLQDIVLTNNDVANFVTGYAATDVTGDGSVNLSDMQIVYNSSGNFVSAEKPDAGSLIQNLRSLSKKEEVEKTLILKDNYPNPFNPSTVISYELRVTNYVSLKVFDIIGKEVATLVNENQNAGTHSVTFEASHLSSGTYFYRLESAGNVIVKRMLLVK